MTKSTGISAIHEDEIQKHAQTAYGLVTRAVVIGAAPVQQQAVGGMTRRHISTVASVGAARPTSEVKFIETVGKVGNDQLMTIPQHALVYRTRRGLAIALAVADVFARQTQLEALRAKNALSPLAGEDAHTFKTLITASAYVAAFSFASYLATMLDGESDSANDVNEPDYLFDNPQDALKSLIAGLDAAVAGSPDDIAMTARARAYGRAVIEGLLQRKGRFEGLASFEDAHVRVEKDDFTLNGFDSAPNRKAAPLVMAFKKPTDIVGNHIAKYQAMKLAKMLVAYDFERQLNPFVELGGFLFTFIGDGNPGTGKTVLIQMTAGLLHDYCQVAGYGFHYENFGVDQISDYQGRSGQNCKAFVNNVLNPKVIGFGTIDDIDQVAGRRDDKQSSAGQQEVTAVLMESFAGANTIIRGNASFGMFSNYPEKVDDALRQRAGARWLVDGPQTRADYIDIFTMLVGKNHSIPLGDHDLLAGQEIKKAVGESYAKHNVPQEEGLLRVFETFQKQHGDFKTLKDVGTYLHMIKEVEPRFTGRAIKNITDAVKMRAMDVDLPDEWFETPETFMHKSYDVKKAMIEELRGPITIEMMLQSINQYADSEFRYSDKSDAAAIEGYVRDMRHRMKAQEIITGSASA
jgi:ATPases of the AAA+ class